MSTAPKLKMTEAQYLAIERAAQTKSDFYAGEMYAMAGAKRNHNLVVTNVVRVLANQLLKRSCELYSNDMRVRVNPSGLFTYPDAVVVCGKIEFLDSQDDTLLNPTLIVEVLSESTVSYDRGFKASCYRKLPSLREYLLIEQDLPQIERYVRTAKGKWMLDEANDLSQTLLLEAIDCELSLAAVYDKVAFARDGE
jgi:Uma2 family endonuclease